MNRGKRVRVAAAQFAVGADIAANLGAVLRVSEAAAGHKPQLLVLPEFINHLSWYDSAEHCYEVSLELDGDFLRQVADAARAADCYLVANCTLRREKRTCSATSLLYSPQGELLGINDKQVLIGHENNFLQRAGAPGPVVETPIARLGMYACMDGVVCETPRYLALRGAQVLCNSVNSFAPDESSLHIPVRAAENKVFVVAANKIGPLVPAEMLDQLSAVTGIPERFLHGAGEAQVVGPDGKVLAIASPDREEVIYADIDPAEADNKFRPDGSDLFGLRRPSLYLPIAQDPATQPAAPAKPCERLPVAMVQLRERSPAALSPALQYIEQAVGEGAKLVVLPELFCTDPEARPTGADARQAQQAVAAIAEVCGDAYVAGSFPWLGRGAELQHAALLIGRDGVRCAQPQLHVGERHSWAAPGDEINTLDLPFAHVGMLTGEDVVYPEAFRLLALEGVDTALVPYCAQEDWEILTGLFERAAENHINMVAVNGGAIPGGTFAARLHKDFTILTPWETREFDGKLTFPPMTVAKEDAAVTHAELTPAHAANKVVSVGTDLLRGRAWALASPLVAGNAL